MPSSLRRDFVVLVASLDLAAAVVAVAVESSGHESPVDLAVKAKKMTLVDLIFNYHLHMQVHFLQFHLI